MEIELRILVEFGVLEFALKIPDWWFTFRPIRRKLNDENYIFSDYQKNNVLVNADPYIKCYSSTSDCWILPCRSGQCFPDNARPSNLRSTQQKPISVRTSRFWCNRAEKAKTCFFFWSAVLAQLTDGVAEVCSGSWPGLPCGRRKETRSKVSYYCVEVQGKYNNSRNKYKRSGELYFGVSSTKFVSIHPHI